MIRSKLNKNGWSGAGMLHACPIPRLAGRGPLSTNRHKRFYRRNAEGCGGSDDKKKRIGRAGTHKVRDTHGCWCMIIRFIADWWLQDGENKGREDVNWFQRFFQPATFLRMRNWTLLLLSMILRKVSKRLSSLIWKRAKKTCRTFGNFHSNKAGRLFLQSSERCILLSLPIPKAFRCRAEVQLLCGRFAVKIEDERYLGGGRNCWRTKTVWFVIRISHFDGQHLLFSWKKSAKDDDFHLYEMDLKTHAVKQLTFGKGHADIEGITCRMRIYFQLYRSGSAVDCWFTEVSNMYLCDREGRYMHVRWFRPGAYYYADFAYDGRVVYTRWDYNDRGQVWAQPLFQMNPDGTGQTEYYGMNRLVPPTTVAQTVRFRYTQSDDCFHGTS